MMSVTASAADLDEYRDIEIISLTESEMVFVYRPESTSWRAGDSEGSSFLDIGRCAVNEKAGEARVPIRKVLVGVPPAGEPQAAVISANYTDIGRKQVVINRPGESSPFENALIQKAKAAASYPTLLYGSPYFIRDQRVIELHIDPVRLSGTNIVTGIAEEITVRVSFNRTTRNGLVRSDDRAFEKIFRATLLNYDQARNWRAKDVSKALFSVSSVSPFSLSSDWVKIGFTESGIYKISRSDLSSAGIDVGTVDPRSFRVFWRGGQQLPVDNAEPRPEFREIAIKVVGEEDGAFDSGDYVLFWMHGADFTEIDSTMAAPRTVRNAYTTENFVWLTHGGSFPDDPKRMTTVSVAPSEGIYQLHERFDMLTRYEEDRLFAIWSGGHIRDFYTWYWHDDEEYSIPVHIDDYAIFEPCTLFVKSKVSFMSVEIQGSIYGHRPVSNQFRIFDIDILRDGANALNFHQSQYGSRSPLLDYMVLVHPRLLRYSGGSLDFYTQNTPGAHRYSIESQSQGTGDAILIRTSDTDNQDYLVDAQFSDGKLTFDWNTTGLQFERFVLCATSDISTPSSIEYLSSNELAVSTGGDLVIIAPESFHTALDEYISYRRQQGYELRTVSVDAIYNNFSGGMPDPIAIRDYLKWNYENSGGIPVAALLVGDGSYDFRNNLGRNVANFVPPYIVENDSTISDENYVHFGSKGWLDSDLSWGTDRGVDMVIARWPVRSSSEIATYIDKLKSYENSANYGPWRTLATLVADDEFKEGESKQSESIHTYQSEILANEHIPAYVDVQKIYLTDYPFDSFKQKPKARARIIQAINDGTVLMNYIGHGNPDVWADERVFYWKEDLYKLTNSEQLVVVFNASCSIGQFDSPLREGMAEELFRYGDGGAIGTVAATRLVFSDPNAGFNYKAFDCLLSGDGYSLCEAVYIAKLLRQISIGSPITNDRYYIVFGDPLMYFGMPKRRAEITSLDPVTLSALDLTTVNGYVAGDDGSIDAAFNGDIYVTVFDAERKKEMELDLGVTRSYTLPGPRIYRGKGTVADGQFGMQFIVPKDIAYGEKSAKISAYAVSATAQASGGLDSIEISGSNPAIADTTGPSIDVSRASGVSLTGGLVRVGEELSVEISDSFGINLSGEVGHAIEVSFDDDPMNSIDLTEEFVYYPASYRSGSVDFEIPGLSSGSHTMKVKAWDSANNSSLRVYSIAVGEFEKLEISGIANYPNPATTETEFSYYLSEQVSDVRIDVYSLAGRLIKTMRNESTREGYNVSRRWNMTDSRGDRIANGVYIYKVSASGRLASAVEGNDDRAEGFGKIVVLK